MNKAISILLAVLIAWPLQLAAASFSMTDWLNKRFNPETVEVRDVEGLRDRIADGKLRLDLHSFLELVLRNSTAINLERLNVYTQADAITSAKAPLDPFLQLSFNATRSLEPTSTQILGAATLSSLTQTSTLNYQQLLPTGQTIQTQFSAVRSSTNDAFYFYNPNIFGTLQITITQPLWQNRTNIAYRGPLEIARTQLVITSEQSQGRIADTISTAAVQYWDAVRARDNIKVQQLTVDLARRSYDRDKQALDLGALASLDIYQSETQVAERNRDLIQSQYDYKVQLDGLRQLIGADLTPELRNTEIVLEDNPGILPERTRILPFEDALALALKVRPELHAAERSVAVDELNARISRDLLRPRLDLQAIGSGTGLSGTQIPITGIPGVITTTPLASTGLGTSLGQLFSFAYPSYGGQLTLTLPIRNSTAQAGLADALVNRTRDRYTERQVRQQITLSVRTAINNLELADATIKAASTARDLAKKNVDAEQQKYELGTITAFEVLDSQNRLASAESAVLNAYVGYQQAYIGYERSTWTLLDGLGMVLQTPKVK